jgi:hypothetical protein
MNEIQHTTTNHAESEFEISASDTLASEIYANSNLKRPENHPNVANPNRDSEGRHSETQPWQILATKSDRKQPQPYYGLGHTERQLFDHMGQTWKHVLTGKSTKLELLEFGIEAAGAAAMIRFGVRQIWPMKALPKASVFTAADDTILSQTITAAQARNHPIMRMHIRTTEAPIIVPR